MAIGIQVRRPDPAEYAPYFQPYMDLVHEDDLFAANDRQIAEARQILEAVPLDQVNCLHEPYTWTIAEAIEHVIDGERIFGYRMARFAAGDSTPLPGFDQDVYAANRKDNERGHFSDLIDELEHLRRGNLGLMRRLTSAEFDRKGVASDQEISVRAIAALLVGHARHHLNIIKKRVESV